MAAFDVSFPLAEIEAELEAFEATVQTAVRPSAQAGAEVLYREVRARVSHIGYKTGNLRNAIYQAYSRENSGPGVAQYNISWNARKAPHGHLVEMGHLQRYAVYLGKDGNWYTAVRPEMRGKAAPSKKASQAQKDAYYVTLPEPKQVPAHPFIRPAVSVMPQAIEAATQAILGRLSK